MFSFGGDAYDVIELVISSLALAVASLALYLQLRRTRG